MQRRRWGVRHPPYPTTRMRSPEGQDSSTSIQPTSPPSCMAFSSNRVGIFLPGASCGPLAARRKQSVAPQRPRGEFPPPGGFPRRSDHPGRQRDVGWSSKGWPRWIIVSARGAPFRPGQPRPRSPAPVWGWGLTSTQAAPRSSGYPGLRASPSTGLPHPREPSGNWPWGSQRYRPGLLRSPEPPPMTKAAAEEPGRPWRNVWQRPASSGVTGVHKADVWVELDFVSRSEAKGWKWKHWGGSY